MRKIDQIIVHHAAGSYHQTMEEVRAWHKRPKADGGRGWADIGYHYWIGSLGMRLARPVWEMGAHDGGENRASIGICVAGNYEDGGLPVTTRWQTLIVLCCDLIRQHSLTPDDIYGHRENEPPNTPTVCPGFNPEELRIAVRNNLKLYS